MRTRTAWLAGALTVLVAGVLLGATPTNMPLASGKVLVGSAGGVARPVSIGGDATMDSTGAVTMGTGAITSGKILDGTIVNADLAVNTAETNLAASLSDHTNIDFTAAHEVAYFAVTTGAIKTAANAQLDYFYINAPLPHYFELKQGVGALGANTLFAANGLAYNTNGWTLVADNTATDSIEITEGGLNLGQSRSFTTGTSAAFTIKCAVTVATRASTTNFDIGFRKLVAYETASTYAELQTAYDDKAMVGLRDNAGNFSTETSKATVNTSTNLAKAAVTDTHMLGLQVLIDGSGNVTYKVSEVTPAGTTAAQTRTAVAAAYAALAADASAVAFQFTAATVVVPSIIFASSGGGTPDFKLADYCVGPQTVCGS